MENEYFDTDEIMLIDFNKNGWQGYFGEREEELINKLARDSKMSQMKMIVF